MNPAIRLCFGQTGCLNPADLDQHNSPTDTLVFFVDGSDAAYKHLADFDHTNIQAKIGLVRTPHFALQVYNADGSLSHPHYVYSQKHRMQWICSQVVSPHLSITITDLTKPDVVVAFDKNEQDQLCLLSYLLWNSMLVAEASLCFPAAVIDRLAGLTYFLTPESMDIHRLRRETDLETLDYNPINDSLAVTVGGDIFSVKLSVLNRFYGDYILPIFNKLLGRRTRIMVTIQDRDGNHSEPQMMSYGQLGALVVDFTRYVKQTPIGDETPLDPEDLLAYSQKVRINDESCLWPVAQQTIADLITTSHHDLVPQHARDYAMRAESSDEASGDLTSESVHN